MKATANHPTGVKERLAQQRPPLHASDWFWRPRYAKLIWALSALYWIGLYAMMLMPSDWLSSFVAGTMVVLIFLFNPITVFAILGYGFLKAKVACGDWIVVPGIAPEHAEWQRRRRHAARLNPGDARSGYMHRDYLEGMAPRPTSHADP